jgi:hypothetical protein
MQGYFFNFFKPVSRECAKFQFEVFKNRANYFVVSC